MASDMEDLELESLRSAVLASLKTKPAQGGISNSATSSKAEGEDEDEDLEALRLAALQSKREGGSASVSRISTPVTGSPLHQTLSHLQPQQQPPLLPRGPPSGNLITIPLQDFSQPQQPKPASVCPQTTDRGDENKEERSTKFSRFESSDSESDLDLDDLLGESDRGASEDSARGSNDSDDDRCSLGRSSSSDDESENASVSEAECDGKVNASASDGDDGDRSDGSDAKGDIFANKDDQDKDRVSNDTDSKKPQRAVSVKSTTDSRNGDRTKERDRRDRRVESRRRTDDRNGQRRNRERDPPGRRDRNDDGYRRDREREKLREDRRRDYEARRVERKRPGVSSKQDQVRRNDQKKPTVDFKTLEARRQKFASGNSVNIKDRTVTLTGVRKSDNCDSAGEQNSTTEMKTVQESNKDIDKKHSAVGSESDISLCSVESEAEEIVDEVEEDKKDSESDSESENELSRFKHTSSNNEAKLSVAPVQSRLITSMVLPKEVSTDVLPRRRPNGRDGARERWKPEDRDSNRRGRDDRGQERERMRRAHLPRHLDRQERSSSRDRLRVEERDSRRRPRDAAAIDRPERKPAENADKKLADRKPPSKRDFVSESSESDNENPNQGLRSFVRTDKPETEANDYNSREKTHRSREVDGNAETRSKEEKRDKGQDIKKARHKRDVKDRIGKRRKEDRPEERRISDTGDDEVVSTEVRRVTLNEEGAQQKKRSVLDRLGTAPSSPERSRGSIKSRLGPVKKETLDPSLDIDSIPIAEDEFLPDQTLGPDGDRPKRRKVEIDDSHVDRTEHVKVKHPEPSDRDMYAIEREAESDMFTVREPPVKRKQLSKSLLSRLSDRPSTLLTSDDIDSRVDESSSRDIEPKERKVKSRDADDISSRKKERKSKIRDVWREAVAIETAEVDRKASRDDDDDASRKKERKSKIRDVWSSKRKAVVIETPEDDRTASRDEDDTSSREKERKSKIRDVWSSKRKAVAIETLEDDRKGSRDDDDDDTSSRKRERKSKIRDVWSSKRKAVAIETTDNDRRASKDEALDERIKKIKAKNAAIIQRQREIEEEKKMFGGQG